jgi:hypothetical protein
MCRRLRQRAGSYTRSLEFFARVLAIPMRDGCDLMDVIGRRLQAQP